MDAPADPGRHRPRSQPRSTRRRSAAGRAASGVRGQAAVRRPAAASSAPARASRASRSSRSCAAVRASAGATPPPSTSSSSGSDLGAQPDPGVGGVVVPRVVPDGQLLRGAGGPGGRPADAEQRAPPRTPSCSRSSTMPATDRGPGPAAQPEQHGLGLVVEGVPERDAGAVRRPPRPQAAYRAVRAAASGPPSAADVDPDDSDRGEAEVAQQAPPSLGGALGRARLQAVVDGHRRRPGTPAPRRLERERPRPARGSPLPRCRRPAPAGRRRAQARAGRRCGPARPRGGTGHRGPAQAGMAGRPMHPLDPLLPER